MWDGFIAGSRILTPSLRPEGSHGCPVDPAKFPDHAFPDVETLATAKLQVPAVRYLSTIPWYYALVLYPGTIP